MPTANAQPTLDQLLGAMGHVRSTNKWDVVCSYTLDDINALLARQYDAKKLVTEVRVGTQGRDVISGSTYTAEYVGKLDAPKLTFVAGQKNLCEVSMPIAAMTCTVRNADGKEIRSGSVTPNHYSVALSIPLAVIDGDTREVRGDGVISFQPEGVHEDLVVVHFRTNEATSYTITPPPGPNDLDLQDFARGLAKALAEDVDEIAYALVAINTKKPAGSTSGSTITPKSFVLTTEQSGETGVLSAYVQCAESGNAQGNPYPSFQPGDQAILPVPQGCTASLIFSQELIVDSFLLPDLARQNFTNIAAGNDTQGNLEVRAAYNAVIKVPELSNRGALYGWWTEETVVDLKKFPYRIRFGVADLLLLFSMSVPVKWTNVAMKPGPFKDPSGIITVHYSLEKKFDFKNIFVVGDTDLAMHCKVAPSDYKVTYTTDDDSFADDTPSTIVNAVKQACGAIIPPLTFDLRGINFVRTTNVLLADRRIVDIDEKQGIRMPHDFFLCGRVIDIAAKH